MPFEWRKFRAFATCRSGSSSRSPGLATQLAGPSAHTGRGPLRGRAQSRRGPGRAASAPQAQLFFRDDASLGAVQRGRERAGQSRGSCAPGTQQARAEPRAAPSAGTCPACCKAERRNPDAQQGQCPGRTKQALVGAACHHVQRGVQVAALAVLEQHDARPGAQGYAHEADNIGMPSGQQRGGEQGPQNGRLRVAASGQGRQRGARCPLGARGHGAGVRAHAAIPWQHRGNPAANPATIPWPRGPPQLLQVEGLGDEGLLLELRGGQVDLLGSHNLPCEQR